MQSFLQKIFYELRINSNQPYTLRLILKPQFNAATMIRTIPVSPCATPSPEPALQVLVRVTVIDLTSSGHSCFSPLKSHCLLNSNSVAFSSLTIFIAIFVLLTRYASSSALRSRRAPFSRTFSANPSFPSASTVTTNTLPAASS